MRYKEGDSTWNHSRGPTGWHCCPGCGGGVALIGIWFREILPPHGEWLRCSRVEDFTSGEFYTDRANHNNS